MENSPIEKYLNPTQLPLYGCLTGMTLQVPKINILPGLVLQNIYVDTFGATMMAFSPPHTPSSPHPTPWAAVRGGFNFESRVEIEITDVNALGNLNPSVAAWLVTAVLRLRVPSPIRLAVLANISFSNMAEQWSEVEADLFESSHHQNGAFSLTHNKITDDQISWLCDILPVAVRLYQEERFYRAFSIYDQALWSPTPEMGLVLVWTAIEILFDLSLEQKKTKAICNSLANYIGENRSDRDHAYQAIKKLYYNRGKIVHSGRQINAQDIAQSYHIAAVAFQHVLINGKLPHSSRT